MANDDLMETPNLGRGEQIDVAAMAAADRARTAASETPVALQLLSALTSKAPRRTSPDIPTSNNSISMASKAGMNALQKAFTEFPNLVENLGSETKAFRIVHDLMGAVSPFMPSGDTNVKNITPSQESKLIDGIEALDNALPQGQSEENIRLNTRRNPYSPEALGGRSISAPSPISTPSPIRPLAQPPLPPPSPPPPQIRPQLPAGPPMQARRPPVSAPVRPPVSAPSSIPMPTVPTGLQLVLQVLYLCLQYLLVLPLILCNKALLLLPRRERQLLQQVQVMPVVYLMLLRSKKWTLFLK